MKKRLVSILVLTSFQIHTGSKIIFSQNKKISSSDLHIVHTNQPKSAKNQTFLIISKDIFDKHKEAQKNASLWVAKKNAVTSFRSDQKITGDHEDTTNLPTSFILKNEDFPSLRSK